MSGDSKTTKNAPPSKDASGAKKKPYATPAVKTYGNIREVTHGTGHSGRKDGVPGSHKTEI